jgi:hypothetical protein
LNDWPPDISLPTFRLDIDSVEAELVLLNDSVDAAITGSPNDCAGNIVGPSVSHGYEEVHDDSFESCRCPRLQLVEQLLRERFVDGSVGFVKKLLRSLGLVR